MSTHLYTESRTISIFQWLVLGAGSILAAGVLHLSYSGLGFPDGHLTELGRVRKMIWPVFIAVNLIITAVCIYFFARILARKKTRRAAPAAVVFVVVNAVCFLSDYLLSFWFEDGTGEI